MSLMHTMLNKWLPWGIVFLLVQTLLAQTPPSGFGGIGMEITKVDFRIIVNNVYPDSPAAKAGIKAGDLIKQVNGESTNNLSLEDVVKKIRGQQGTNVALDIQRTGEDGKITDLTLSTNREFISANGAQIVLPPATGNTSSGITMNPTLYFVPLTSRVTEGSVFPLNLYLNNSKGILADELAFWIKYDPKALELIANQDGKKVGLDNRQFSCWTTAVIYSRETTGEIYVRLLNTKADRPLAGTIATLLFKATGTVPVSQIRFEFQEPGYYPNTALTYRKRDVLGSDTDPKDGTIGASVRILPSSNSLIPGNPLKKSSFQQTEP